IREAQERARKKRIFEPKIKTFEVRALDPQNRDQCENEKKTCACEESTGDSQVRVPGSYRAQNRNGYQKASVSEKHPRCAAASAESGDDNERDDANGNRQLKTCFDSKAAQHGRHFSMHACSDRPRRRRPFVQELHSWAIGLTHFVILC